MAHRVAGAQQARRWLDLGADLISFGRAFIGNPDLIERLRRDLPIAGHDPQHHYTGGDTGYLTYAPYQPEMHQPETHRPEAHRPEAQRPETAR